MDLFFFWVGDIVLILVCFCVMGFFGVDVVGELFGVFVFRIFNVDFKGGNRFWFI